MPEPTPPTGRTWRLSVEIPAPDDATAAKRAEDIADHMAAEHGTRNPIVTRADGEQRDRLIEAIHSRRPTHGRVHDAPTCNDLADAVVAALPELARLRAEAQDAESWRSNAEEEIKRLRAKLDRVIQGRTKAHVNRNRERHRAEQAEAERDTAQAAITRLQAGIAEAVRQIHQWMNPDDPGPLFAPSHAAEVDRTLRKYIGERTLAALTPPSERCTCGQTACESELCDCDATPCPVNHRAEETDHG